MKAIVSTSRERWAASVAESTRSCATIDVEGPLAEFSAWRLDGTRLDHFVLGEGLTECAAESDCAGRTAGTCGPGDEGSWACVHGGCVWNCASTIAADGDADGGTDAVADAGTDADGGADGGFDAAADGSVGTDGRGGRGCRATGDGETPAALLLLVPAALVGRSRTRSRRDAPPGPASCRKRPRAAIQSTPIPG
jgi:hypothetical protein